MKSFLGLVISFIGVFFLVAVKLPPQEFLGIILLIVGYDLFMNQKMQSIAHL